MSPRERLEYKVAGLVVVRIGTNMSPPRRVEEDAEMVADLVDRYPLGGLLLFNGMWPETRNTLIDLQRRAGDAGHPGLLVMTDMERGVGQQVRGASTFPHLGAYGAWAQKDAAAAEDAARRTAAMAAHEALACGIHVACAPVADLDRNPDNPIIATRAFGADPKLVAGLVRAYVEGLRESGLLVTVKHFPGHGGTSEDSHAVLPTVDDSREMLLSNDLEPFREAFDAGAELIMTAHVVYTALDSSGEPATRSRAILTDLLRGEMGFKGAVLTDSLQMGGIKSDVSEAESAAVQIEAGVDLLLDPEDAESLIKGLADAVEQGRLSETRVDEALARADALRKSLTQRFGDEVFVLPPYPSGDVAGTEAAEWSSRVASSAIRTYGELDSLPEKSVAVLIVPYRTHLDPPEQPLGEAFRKAFPTGTYFECTGDTSTDDRERILEAVKAAPAVLVAAIVKPSAWHHFGLSDDLKVFAEALIAASPYSVGAVLGAERGVEDLKAASVRLCAFSDMPSSQIALAEYISH
ncbi:hypothetical protein BH23BAC4_BH23BAC4_04070 [soil metagenome]